VPYGYTVVTWTSGGVLISTHGPPTVLDAYLFLGGACLGFALLWVLAGKGEVMGREPGPVGSVFAAAVALGCGGAVAHLVHGRAAYALVSFAATVAYLVARA
jgi:hypothetical protein